MKKSDPSGGDRQETFLTSAVGLISFAPAPRRDAGAPAADEQEERDEQASFCFPFEPRQQLDALGHANGQAVSDRDRQFFDEFYGTDDAWRRIDHDWLFAANELALHLDRHTNNTSLVLAFELGEPGEGPVLLFPADAQVGNWLSWQDLTWTVAEREIGIEDLLERMAVYKVGHHASHNATLARDAAGADYGLRLVRRTFLALIPVDQSVAEKLRGWDMPYIQLYEFLKQRTQGNILRSDDRDEDLPTPRLRWGDVPGVAGARWRRSRKKKSENSGGGALSFDLSISSDR